jgi:hypothetical protein
MFNNPTLNASIQTKPSELINWAWKLRHPLLFRECIIYLLGPFNNPRYFKLENPKLVEFARGIDEKFRARLFNVMKDLTELGIDKETYRGDFDKIAHGMLMRSIVTSVSAQAKKVRYPAYFRKLYSLEYTPEKLHTAVKRILEPVLRNNLVLSGSGMQAGEGSFGDYFLCFDISDSVMPWNNNETDW